MAVIITLESESMSFADWARESAKMPAPARADTANSTVQQPHRAADRAKATVNGRSEPSWRETFAFPVYSGLLDIVG
ncbi:MAG TPA: hypothetical protein VH414_13940 [Lichenihabitans sp.]|jgi:hypothetical protein|nr:hypothetical protein [Lichenihabitans sp.]